MKKILSVTFFLFLLASTQGCVSTRDITTSVYSAPKEISDAIVYFYRDTTMPTRANLDVKVDGQKKALLPPSRFTWIKIPPGNHKVSVGYPSFPDMSAKAELTAEAGKVYVFKYLSSSGGGTLPILGANGAIVGMIQMGSKPWTRLTQEPDGKLQEIVSNHSFVEPQIE